MNNILQKLTPDISLSQIKFIFGDLLKPKRDWIILLVIFFLLIIISISFDVYIYRQIVSGDMYVSVNREDLVIENLKTDQLKKISDSFEDKKAKITGLKLEKTVDPSL